MNVRFCTVYITNQLNNYYKKQKCEHTGFGRNQVGRRSKVRLLQQHHRTPSFQGSTFRTACSCQRLLRKSACTCGFQKNILRQFQCIPQYFLSIKCIIWELFHSYLSLKAKLSAWVGKYRMTLAKLPRQKARNPCSLGIRTKQSTMPKME
jgi:hypothetical protein